MQLALTVAMSMLYAIIPWGLMPAPVRLGSPEMEGYVLVNQKSLSPNDYNFIVHFRFKVKDERNVGPLICLGHLTTTMHRIILKN